MHLLPTLAITLATMVLAAAADYPAAPATVTGPLDFTLTANDGKAYPLAQLRGKVVLLVNVASRCGFTKQYAGLETLYTKDKERGLVIVGVPANDFGAQEPGTDAEILEFCTKNFKVTFPLMAKTTVKGDGITPLYAWLTTKSAFPGPIAWNFNKWLIGRDGQIKARYESKFAPEDEALLKAIETELAAAAPATK